MGAWMTESVASGKTASQAWSRAVAEARDYYGHQEGYSGAVNSGGTGFIKVDLPKGCSLRKFQELLEEAEYVGGYELESARDDLRAWSPGGFFNQAGNKKGWKGQVAKAKARIAKEKKAYERFVSKVEKAGFYLPDFQRLAEAYNDKWGDYLCVELSPYLAKKTYPNHTTKRGERLFVFFGYAPS